MLLLLCVFTVGVLGWGILRARARRPDDPVRAAELDTKIRALASPDGFRVEPETDGVTALSGETDGVALRVEAGTRGYLFDGDVVLIAPCESASRLVVWPREPPDDVVDGLGVERSTGDEVFDARYAAFCSSREMLDRVLDATTRSALTDLGLGAIVVGPGEALLLLPGVPSRSALRTCGALLARVAKRCA